MLYSYQQNLLSTNDQSNMYLLGRYQQTPDFLYALSCCLEVLRGVPKAIVPDNLKVAVVKAYKYEPVLKQPMKDFDNQYGTVVVPTRPGKPKDKSLVENQVKIIKFSN